MNIKGQTGKTFRFPLTRDVIGRTGTHWATTASMHGTPSESHSSSTATSEVVSATKVVHSTAVAESGTNFRIFSICCTVSPRHTASHSVKTDYPGEVTHPRPRSNPPRPRKPPPPLLIPLLLSILNDKRWDSQNKTPRTICLPHTHTDTNLTSGVQCFDL